MKKKPKAAPKNLLAPIPEGHEVKGVSTLFDDDGLIRGQWPASPAPVRECIGFAGFQLGISWFLNSALRETCLMVNESPARNPEPPRLPVHRAATEQRPDRPV